jgi:hypothetical protein
LARRHRLSVRDRRFLLHRLSGRNRRTSGGAHPFLNSGNRRAR